MRDSMIFYRSFADAIRNLPEEEQLKSLWAVINYALDGAEPEGGIEKSIWIMAKPQIDSNNQRYENGRKGGRPSKKASQSKTKAKPNNNQTETKPKPNRNQTETKAKPKPEKAKPNVNVNVNDNVYINNPPPSPLGGRETQKKMLERLLSDRDVPEMIRVSLEEWIGYKGERNERYKEAGMKALISQAVNETDAHGPAAVAKVIRESMSSGYKGIMWDRLRKKAAPAVKFNNHPSRTYDMAALERELIASN